MSDQSISEPAGQPAEDPTAQHPTAQYPTGQHPTAQYPWVQPATSQHPYGHSGSGQPFGSSPYAQAPSGQPAHGQMPSGQPAYGQAPFAETSAPSEQPYFVPTAHQQAWSEQARSQQAPSQQAWSQQGWSAPLHYPGQQPYPGQPYWAPPPVAPVRNRSRRVLAGSVAAAAVAALAVGGIAVAVDRPGQSSSQTALSSPNGQVPFGQGGTGQGNSGQGGSGQTLPNGGFPFGGVPGSGGSDDSNGSGNSNGATSAQITGPATTAQQVGVVDITTTLNYGQGKAAGTGVVLTSTGEILTNNHVVQDSTAITVTVVSTGKSYPATVVGTDPTDDVSVLQLKNASGLATAKLAGSNSVAVGDKVTAVGNAGGKGGTPTAAPGTVTGLNQSLTASDANGSNAERLTGMIQISAAIEAGDSGGPLYDAGGSVIGIDTAASSASGRFSSAAVTGYAIPIAKALGIADQIESGQASSTVHIGYPAFLGVQLSPNSQSATISGVVDGSAAAKAGLQSGDTVTAVDDTAISTASGLSSTLEKYRPGNTVRLRYTDSSGQSHSVTVTLGAGPAD